MVEVAKRTFPLHTLKRVFQEECIGLPQLHSSGTQLVLRSSPDSCGSGSGLIGLCPFLADSFPTTKPKHKSIFKCLIFVFFANVENYPTPDV